MEKRLIDANALKEYATGGVTSVGILTLAEIDRAPTIDAVEVVRCKDCKHWSGLVLGMRCMYHSFPPNAYIYKQADDFCSKGERREDNADLHLPD